LKWGETGWEEKRGEKRPASMKGERDENDQVI
jgi:hypothetical protein